MLLTVICRPINFELCNQIYARKQKKIVELCSPVGAQVQSFEQKIDVKAS